MAHKFVPPFFLPHLCHMNYCIDSDNQFPIFQINERIGFDEDTRSGIDGNIFSKEFFQIDGKKPSLITYYTNSTGGDVQDGISMFTSIINAKSKTKSVISGFCYSTAGWLALAADEVVMYNHSHWMAHMPVSESETKMLKAARNMIATVISEKSGRNNKPKKTKQEILDMMESTTYMYADEMKEQGLINDILDSNNQRILNVVSINNEYLKQQKILNSLLIKKEKKSIIMDISAKILNRLSLANGSDESDVLAKIAKIENRANDLNEDLKISNEKLRSSTENFNTLKDDFSKIENSLKQKETELSEAKEKIRILNEEKASLESKISENERISNEQKATIQRSASEVIINGFIASGKIKNEVASIWIEKHIQDPVGVEAILNAQPVSLKVPSPMDPKQKIDNLGLPLNASVSDFMELNRKKRENKI